MKWLIIVLLLFATWLCVAQEGIYVPDPALREALQKRGLMQGDTIFTQIGLLQLDISSSNIHDLTGLRAFRDLRSLYAAANNLTELNDLPPKLTALSVFNNKIERLDFKQIPVPLENLHIGKNPLSTLLNLPTSLQSLDISNCQLHNLDAIEKWPDSLQTLDLSNNPLDRIIILPQKLQSLNLSNCRFRRLPALPTTLNYLNYAGNPIDTALLPKPFKICPCVSPEQNCWPAEWTRWNLLNLPSDTFTVEEFDRIRAISIRMQSIHGWGFGNDSIEIFYERKGDFFRTTKAFYKNSGILFSGERHGEGASVDSIWFERNFSADQLFSTLHNLRLTKLQLDERDFDYEKSKFKMDLSKIARYDYQFFGCEDCTQYSISIQLIEKDGSRRLMGLGFSDYVGFSPENDGITIHYMREMLEWVYLCQLSRLFFPENIALNNSYFKEENMERLALWAKKVFPELNNE